LGGPDCCVLNAKVAANMGMQDLSDTWDFVDLIIRDEVPLDIIDHPYKEESILVVSRRTIARLERKDSAVDLSYDTPGDGKHKNVKGSIKWASHPFGQRLVKAL
jgi:hypothetical protein